MFFNWEDSDHVAVIEDTSEDCRCGDRWPQTSCPLFVGQAYGIHGIRAEVTCMYHVLVVRILVSDKFRMQFRQQYHSSIALFLQFSCQDAGHVATIGYYGRVQMFLLPLRPFLPTHIKKNNKKRSLRESWRALHKIELWNGLESHQGPVHLDPRVGLVRSIVVVGLVLEF